jgi:beta-glucosidase
VTQWPELLGLGALGDVARVKRFGEIARMEYRAVGIQEAFSPQVDLASEPRWSRITGTFGADPQLSSVLGGAYVQGFQRAPNGLAPMA